MRYRLAASIQSTGLSGLVLALAMLLGESPASSYAKPPDQPLDVDRVVKSYVASLQALRSKPLRIKTEAVSAVDRERRIVQTLLLSGADMRLDQSQGKVGNLWLRSQTSIVDHRWLMVVNNDRLKHVSVSSCLNMPDDRWSRAIAPLRGAEYLGISTVTWRGRCHDLVDVIPTLQIVGGHETLDGSEVVLLEGVSDDVALRLWVDVSAGYLLKKYECRPVVPDQWTDKNLDRIPSHSLYTCEFSQFQKVGDLHFPGRVQIHSVSAPCYIRQGKVFPSRAVDGKFALVWSCELPKTVAKNDFNVTIDVPDGTRVSMEDARNLAFIWRGGKIIPDDR